VLVATTIGGQSHQTPNPPPVFAVLELESPKVWATPALVYCPQSRWRAIMFPERTWLCPDDAVLGAYGNSTYFIHVRTLNNLPRPCWQFMGLPPFVRGLSKGFNIEPMVRHTIFLALANNIVSQIYPSAIDRQTIISEKYILIFRAEHSQFKQNTNTSKST
jgi:hypothetical protein